MARLRVFFSYSGAEREIVNALVEGLKEQPAVECFAFEHNMHFGDNLVEEVRQRLHWCNYFVPVISKVNQERPWLIFEINTAIIRCFENECTLLPVLSDVTSDDLFADLKQYKAIIVDASGDYVNCIKQRILNLNLLVDERQWHLFRPLPRDFDLPALLSWKVVKSKLYGRTKELEELKQWALDQQAGARVRIVSGPGGSGKTRLAAELAMELWKCGWDQQFIRCEEGVPASQGLGSLWIIDYPEEQLELARFFRQIRTFRGKHRVRILMLTRLPRQWWLKHSCLRTAHVRDLLGDTFDLEVEGLSAADTLSLYREVVQTLARWYNKTLVLISDEALLQWRCNAPEHRLPLYITALALHMISSGATKLDLSGGEVMRELVWREIERVDCYASPDPDNPQEWPSRVLALAALTECLGQSTLKRLANQQLEMNMPPINQVVDLVRKTPLWNVKARGVLPLRPDVFAAAFLYEVLSAREDVAAQWLWQTIEPELTNPAASIRDRLGRLIFDMQKISDEQQSKLSHWLSQMIADEPNRAIKLKDMAKEQRPPEFLLPLMVKINLGVLTDANLSANEKITTQRILGYQLIRLARHQEAAAIFDEAVRSCESSNNQIELAECLRGLSAVVARSDSKASITWASRALGIVRKLADYADGNGGGEEGEGEGEGKIVRQDALARALNDYALAIKGQSESPSCTLSALDALKECVTIYQQLLQGMQGNQQHVYQDNLARALFNLANQQWGQKQYQLALSNSARSVDIRRRLYANYRWRYARYFAMSLNQFGAFSLAKKNTSDAILATQQTVAIYAELYKANPAQFGVDLVSAMGYQSDAVALAGDKIKAIKLRQTQADFIKKVLSQGRIARYSHVLGDITLQLVAAGYCINGNAKLAIKACTQAIELLKTFRANEPQLWNKQLHYVLVAGYLNRANAIKKQCFHKQAIGDYAMGVAEADQLNQQFSFLADAQVLKELCLFNRSIELLKCDKVEQARVDITQAMVCEENLRQVLATSWPLQQHDQVLMSLSVLTDNANKLTVQDTLKISQLTQSISHGLIRAGKLSPKDTVAFWLKSGVGLLEQDPQLASNYLEQAVNTAKTIDECAFTDLYSAANFYNDTAYRIGQIAKARHHTQHILYALILARSAVAIASDKENTFRGICWDTLGLICALAHRFNAGINTSANASIEAESKTAFLEAISLFRQLKDEHSAQQVIKSWTYFYGPYSEKGGNNGTSANT
jgi:tetratricopeptide (TPR) repeat protein